MHYTKQHPATLPRCMHVCCCVPPVYTSSTRGGQLTHITLSFDSFVQISHHHMRVYISMYIVFLYILLKYKRAVSRSATLAYNNTVLVEHSKRKNSVVVVARERAILFANQVCVVVVPLLFIYIHMSVF